jgi:DNA repair protein RecN (Recombination protein N)
MLQSLRIENYAIIEKVEIDFDPTLNIITGETGAGKSILLGALSLIMGQRADTTVLYNTNNKCIVEAVFTDYPNIINSFLKEADFDTESELIIRREISTSGKSRAFINDTPTKLSFLQSLTVDLIDLNSQFEITEIQNPKFHLNIIDALAGSFDLVKNYKETYSLFKAKEKTLTEIENMESNQIKEMDFIKFQFEELNNAELVEGELAILEADAILLEKTEEVKMLMEETRFLLTEAESNIKESLMQLYYKWDSFGEIHPGIKKAIEKFIQIGEDIEEIASISDDIGGKAESDPKKLKEVQERLDLIFSLQRKHNVKSLDELMVIFNEYESRIEAFDNSFVNKDAIAKEILKLKASLEKQAVKISEGRKKVFIKLEKDVNEKLNALSMASAEIKVDHVISDEYRSDGKDIINILFKANKGSTFLPIKKVASGGESARLMLSLKSTVAHVMELPTMIFDEIDTGVSGDVAGKMGNILKELSKKHQLISITHSPQVASRADKHFFVYKEDKKDRTVTHVKILEDEDRVTEIAKMLSGNPPSTYALENAKELIEG